MTSFGLTCFEINGCVEIQNAKQWLKLYPRVCANPALNNWPLFEFLYFDASVIRTRFLKKYSHVYKHDVVNFFRDGLYMEIRI